MLNRKLITLLQSYFFKGKIIQLLGARQVGKSTLLPELVKEYGADALWLNGDEWDMRQILSKPTTAILKNLIGNKKVVIIDEAQRVENIGITLKIIADNIKGIQVIATGSSAFELSNRINEPLTGRKYEFFLYPLSFGGMVNQTLLIVQTRIGNHIAKG